MHLSIIIVSWNTKTLLEDCLQSIESSPPQMTYETWVVDNASVDGSVEMVRARFPHVRLAANTRNVGFAPANNQAIRQCTGRFVLILNPDTVVKPGAIDCLVAFLEAHPECGAVGARLLNPDGSLQPSCSPEPSLRRETWRMLHLDALHPYGMYAMHTWDLITPHPVDNLQGACLLVPHLVFDQVGLFDESFFIYSEETDLCHRIRAAGRTLYWLPQAEVVHFGGQSTRQVAEEMFLHLYRSKLLYYRKHRSCRAAGLYKWVLVLASLLRLALWPLAWIEPHPQRAAHLSLWRNYCRLLAALPEM